ncbi:hypothetical protein HAX54_014423, partial [Datura stramonium]|nr:hypothetical protein [Datura stramonium]
SSAHVMFMLFLEPFAVECHVVVRHPCLGRDTSEGKPAAAVLDLCPIDATHKNKLESPHFELKKLVVFAIVLRFIDAHVHSVDLDTWATTLAGQGREGESAIHLQNAIPVVWFTNPT